MAHPIFAHPILDLVPAGYRPHALHDGGRHWPETNCYVDLWIEVLAQLGREPRAMLGFTVAQDFEGDQFTFFKVPLDDLETLYGLRVTELAIFDRLDGHVAAQIARGRLVLVELDSFYLPDTRGVAYGRQHTKTTVGITALDPVARRMRYFHNAGFFELEGADYDGLFGAIREPTQLFPYAEFVKIGDGLSQPDLVLGARRLLAQHLARRPATNPIRAYQAALAGHMADLAERPGEYFHVYAFNTLRQLGANFELLAAHLAWLGETGLAGLAEAEAAALAIAEGAKGAQFKLARAMARKRFDGLADTFSPLADEWDRLMAELVRVVGPEAGTLRRAA